jgi:hypothetical protein
MKYIYNCPMSPQAGGLATNANMANAHADIETCYFEDIVFYLKLRWLLRLHSGLCELDNNMCSLKKCIYGMYGLQVQQVRAVICCSDMLWVRSCSALNLLTKNNSVRCRMT